MSKKTFTAEEVNQLLIDERKRASEIAYSFYRKHAKEVGERNKIKYDEIAHIREQKANVARMIGDSISDQNSFVELYKSDKEEKNIKYWEAIWNIESPLTHWEIINKYGVIRLLYFEDIDGNPEMDTAMGFEAFQDLINFCKILDKNEDTIVNYP